MANDFERRLGRLEDRFVEYMAIFYRWLDELRADHEQSKIRIAQNEETLREVRETLSQTKETLDRTRETLDHTIEIQQIHGQMLSGIVNVQENVLKLLDRMDLKLDTLLNRGTNGQH